MKCENIISPFPDGAVAAAIRPAAVSPPAQSWLYGDWSELISDLGHVGAVASTTHNAFAALSASTEILPGPPPSATGHPGSQLTPLMQEWSSCELIEAIAGERASQRICIRDAQNLLVHSIELCEHTDQCAWDALIALYRCRRSAANVRARARMAASEAMQAPSLSAHYSVFFGFQHLVAARIIGKQSLVALCGYLCQRHFGCVASLCNSSLLHQVRMSFEAMHVQRGSLELRTNIGTLKIRLDESLSFWIVIGSLDGVPVNAIEVHDVSHQLILRLATANNDFDWNNRLYLAR